ncbi:ABC transporter transmembrane domain-containing protein [Planctomycetota bacterium]
MHAFTRIFKYVRPQWPRVVAAVLTAVVIMVLFTGSFATVIPLLKVMMGQEGLHGWVDRKTCDWRYEMDFYVPDSVDLMDSNIANISRSLLVVGVEDEGKAQAAGFIVNDRIVGFGAESTAVTSRSELLETLADAESESLVTVSVERYNEQRSEVEHKILHLDTGTNSVHIERAIGFARWAVGFVPRGDRSSKEKAVVLIISLMAVITFVRCVATFYQKYLAEKIVQVAVAALREDAFAHVMVMPIGFFARRGTSDTINRLIVDIGGTGKGVKILLGKALREPLKALGCLIGAMLISWKLVIIFLCCAPFTFGLAVFLGRKMKKYTTRSLISSANMLGRLNGAINALRVVKVYNQQGHESLAYKGINKKFLRQSLRIAKVQAATGPTMEILGMIAGSAALLVGVHWITRGHMDSTSFFLLLIYLGTAAESIRKASDVWNKVQSANAAAERVFAVVDQPVELEKSGAVEMGALKNKIEFKDVVFSYNGSSEPVLKGVNLTVQAGHNIAIVGPNGSGKTTLVNLMPRFYDVESGSILIDGQDIRGATLKSLRDQIGLVTQEVVTFNDTIAANIAYGNPGASREQIIDAAKRAFADEFISPLPESYNTVIGEHGCGLSGGQLQRIIIARAILKNPPILIFDEATSQVDANSEAKIHKAIEEIMHGRTSFIIAHRFSTVISADVIVVMDQGVIVAQGQHEELIKQCPLYQSLYETQLMSTED